jgi:antitoxin component HigA of HigAB toxin-antitoxin module/mRNA-degrading endonuclease HigB of HigAB toxin-antitoxin module
MRVIAKRTLLEFWESTPKYADAADPLKSWYREAKQPIYLTPAAVKAQYRNATILQNNRTIFNIADNKYRLVVDIDYTAQMMFIRFIGTHQDYDSITAGRLEQRSGDNLNPAFIKPIKTEADYQAVLQQAGALMSSKPSPPEAAELDILATVIELYEDTYFPMGLPDPIAAIQFRLEQADRSEADLIPIIGSENLVAEVLSKRQPLTLEMIRALHSHLGIPADVLLQ